jgi:4-amino-4-deoxy-L-arabinose transferase-like glycosyltransferase
VAEARNAECAREMMENREWIVPTFNGELRTDKPALEYYGIMAGYWLGGINERSARLFSAFCGLLVVLATFWIARRHWGKKAAWWSAFTLLSSMHVIIQFRLATPDPYLILCHTLSVYFFYEGWFSRRWRWFAGMYVFLGLGVLAKGPVGLLLPSLSLFVFLLATKTFNWQFIRQLKPWWGTILVLLFSLPWYWAVHVETGGLWTKGFFVEHNLERFNDGLEGHKGPFVMTVLFVLAGMLPFSVFAVRAVKTAWKNRRQEPLLVMAMASVAVVVVFYAFSHTKLINYTSPAYPFFALLTGYFIARLSRHDLQMPKVRAEVYIIAAIAIVLPVGVYFFVKNTEPLNDVAWVALFTVLLPLGAIAALVLSRKSEGKAICAVALSFMATTILVNGGAMRIINEQSPVEKYKELVREHPHVVAYKNFDNAFSFYAQQPIPVFQTEEELEAYLARHDNVLVLSRDRDLSYMDTIPKLMRIGVDRDLFSRRFTGVYHER